MPTISIFYGITIRLYDAPPHFHAVYGDNEASVLIETGRVDKGHLPRSAANLVAAWSALHRAELTENWRRAQNNEPLKRIAALDADEGQ